MKNDLLTVLVLTYNHKDYIAKAIDSILEQKTDFSFVINVADDCSTDGTKEILLKYKGKHPDKIKLYLNGKNVGVEKNMHDALLNIKTAYFAFLDGDDRWCDENKLQMQVDALERNPECTICGHNTIMHNVRTGEEELFIGSLIEYRIKDRYSVDEPFRVHPSSRVYRNIFDFSRVPTFMIYDTALYLLYLSKGDLYYLDRIMSVYNITGQGIMSGADKMSQKILSLTVAYKKNKYFNFKYDKTLSPNSGGLRALKTIFGKRLGWFIYFHFKLFLLKTNRYLMLNKYKGRK
jgi:glycosyltransferase involved in cell wall biosynthesis